MSPTKRAESQRRTRAALLEAARTEFARHGFHAASLERIAESAGFTRGAIYKNFADKYDLFAAVLSEWFARQTSTMSTDLAAAPEGPPQLAVLQAWFDERLVPQSLGMAYSEFSAAAASRPQARELLARHLRAVREQIAVMVDDYCSAREIAMPIPVEHFAAMIAAVATGLADQRRIESEAVPAELYGDALTFMWLGALATSTE